MGLLTLISQVLDGHFDLWDTLFGIHYLICVHASIFTCLLHTSILPISWILQN